MSEFLYSGEPLPDPPRLDVENLEELVPELDAFHRKIIDYLRRLGAKLSNVNYAPPMSEGAEGFSVFCATLDVKSDFTPASATWEDIPWETLIRKDTDVFSHSVSTNPGEITVLKTGFYLVHLEVQVDSDFASGETISLRINEQTEGALDYGLTESYQIGGLITLSAGLNLVANQVLELQHHTTASGGSILDLRRTGTRATILYTPHRSGSTDIGSGVGEGFEDPIKYFT